MKRIHGVILSDRIEHVTSALLQAHITLFQVYEVRDYTTKGPAQKHRGHDYRQEFVTKYSIEIDVPDDLAEDILRLVVANAQTNGDDDGRVVMVDVNRLVDISTGVDITNFPPVIDETPRH